MSGHHSLIMKRSAPSLLRDIEPAFHVRSHSRGGKVELLDWQTGQRIMLDSASARMWSLLLSTGSRAATLQALLLEGDGSPAQVQHSLDAFVHRMTAHNLLHIN
jgi:hypothetical protein